MDFQQLDDIELIREINHYKEERALDALYERYGRLVFSVAYRVVESRETAEEITLDVFTRVWEKSHTYDDEKAKFVTWLMRLTRNRAIDVLRREQVRPENYSIGWQDIIGEPIANSHNPEQQTSLALQQERVRQALAALPDSQREPLLLAYFRGMSHREIANYLEEPLGTVKGRIRAGMQALRGMLITGQSRS